jgi:hypothetical protein
VAGENVVEIRVRINKDGVFTSLAEIERATKASTDKQGGLWSSLGSSIATTMGRSLNGVGVAAAGALGVGLTGPLVAAGLAVGSFAAVAIPELMKVQKAMSATGTAGAKAMAALSPGERALVSDLKGLEGGFRAVQTALAPVVSRVADLAVKTGMLLLPALKSWAVAGGSLIQSVLTPMNALFASPFFGNFVKQMSVMAVQMGPLLGQVFVSLLKSLMQIWTQAGPAALQFFKILLPAVANAVSGLVPFIVAVTKIGSALLTWLNNSHLLIPVIAAVGLAVAAAGGPVYAIAAAFYFVAGSLIHLWQTSQTFRNVMSQVFAVVGGAALKWAQYTLDIMHVVVGGIMMALSNTIHWARLAADALGMHFLDAVDNGMNKARGATDRFFNHAHELIQGWQHDVANMPKEIRIKGDISDAQRKLALLRADMAKTTDPVRKARIEAKIDQAEAMIARLKAELASIQNRNVVITTTYQGGGTGGQGGLAHGGIVGAAGGGPRGGWTRVGEAGPELVKLPTGSTVYPHGQSQQMAAQGSGGGVVRLEMAPGGGTALEQMFWTWFRHQVRVKGGNPDVLGR